MKRGVLIFSLIFSAAIAQAKIFEINGGAGIKTGEICEHVFYNGKSLSRLDWNTVLMPYLTVGARLDVINIVLDADFSFGIKGTQGILKDWDFFELNGEATHFSRHDLYTDKYFDANAKLGYRFQIYNLSLIPQLGFMYRETVFEGNDGYTQYVTGWGNPSTYPATFSGDSSQKYWTADREKTLVSGNMIAYKQKTYMPYLNVEAQLHLSKSWRWSFFAGYSPYIVLNAFDDHVKWSNFYLDELRGGFAIKAGSELRWKFICIGFLYEFLKMEDGITGQSKTQGSDYKKIDTTPGIDWNVWSVYLKVRI